MIVLLFAVVPY